MQQLVLSLRYVYQDDIKEGILATTPLPTCDGETVARVLLKVIAESGLDMELTTAIIPVTLARVMMAVVT